MRDDATLALEEVTEIGELHSSGLAILISPFEVIFMLRYRVTCCFKEFKKQGTN